MNPETTITERVSRHLILIGALQGVVLCWLWKSHELTVWPATNGLWLGFFVWSSLSLPFLVYLSSHTGLNQKTRRTLCVTGAAFFSAIGVYAGWAESPLEVVELASPPASFAQAVAAILLAFMLVPLVAAWRAGHWSWNYQQLFELAWRNALLCAAVAALTGIFWGVLFTGAALMESLGVGFFKVLFQKAEFVIPVTGTVVGAIFSLALARVQWLINVRQFWLALNAWLLPLLLFFGVMWVIAIPSNGLDTLFATKNAAFFLLWFSVLAVKFSNAAWQDGTEKPVYPAWLARLLMWAWLCMLVVSTVAIWALGLRVQQYGWTEERVWAAVIALIALIYAAGYSLSLIKKAQSTIWMSSIGKTNIAVALVAVLTLILLISPVLDPRRIAVNSQLSRLHHGEVSATEFDYHHLRWEAGRWGLNALQQLSEHRDNQRAIEIADRAQLALAQKNRWGNDFDETSQAALENRIKVIPSARRLPATLLALLQSNENVDWRLRQCKKANNDCAIWLHDFNGDEKEEALLLMREDQQRSASLLLLTLEQERWVIAAQYRGVIEYQTLIDNIVAGKVQFTAPQWPELMVNKTRLTLTQE